MIKQTVFIISFLLHNLILCAQFAPEICTNGKDDDGDGLIDLNDPECKCKGIKDTLFVPSSLIPNPSFEDYVCCPTGLAQLTCSRNWIQASPGTSDYYHTCGYKDDFQRGKPPLPLPAGNGYVGFLDLRNRPGTNNTYKEYIGACLNSQMIPGREYTLSFWVGFGSRGSTWGPRASTTLGIFGTSRCANLPFGAPNGVLCPTNYPGWFNLTQVSTSGTNTWRKVTVKIRPSVSVEAICVGSSCTRADGDYYFWLDELILEESVKFDSLYINIVGNPCTDSLELIGPSTAVQRIQFQWFRNGIAIPGADSSNYVIPRGQEGKYQLMAIDGPDCELSNVFNYNLDTFNTAIKRTICYQDSFVLQNQIFKESGSYTLNLKSIKGCDSIISLDLTRKALRATLVDTTICVGDSLRYNQITYNKTGIYERSLKAFDGCDSLFTLNLRVVQIIETKLDTAICEGESVTFDGKKFILRGSYSFYSTAASGCDSVFTLNLNINQDVTTIIDTSICENSFIKVGQNNYDKSGAYTINLIKTDDCDSTVFLNLNVNPVFSNQVNRTICDGDFVDIGGQMIYSEGVHQVILQSEASCDSLVQLNLKINPTNIQALDTNICEGERLVLGSDIFTQAGSYQVNYLNEFGCDSLLLVNLKILKPAFTRIDTHLCAGFTINVGGNLYSTAGLYTLNLNSFYACDSLLEINILQRPSYNIKLDTNLCEGSSILVGSQRFNQTGAYPIGLVTADGCDSLINLTLNMKPSYQLFLDTTICGFDSIIFGGNVIKASGQYTNYFLSYLNCDSLINLKVLKSDPIEINSKLQDIKCFGESSGEIKLQINGGTSPLSYKWNTGSGSIDIFNLNKGFYTITVTDAFGCASIKNFTIREPELLQMIVKKIDASCLDLENGKIFINSLSGGKKPYLIYLNDQAINNVESKARVGNHTIVLLDSNDCMIEKMIEIFPADIGYLDLSPEEAHVFIGDTIWANLSFTNLDSVVSIEWTGNAQISCSNCTNNYIIATQKESIVKVKVIDSNGCEYEDQLVLFAKQNYFVPNVFSPNGDNINDYFNIITDRSFEKIVLMQIYDRWGELVHQSNNISPNTPDGAWTGLFREQSALPGVYVYIFILEDKVGTQFKVSGDVTLLR